MEIINIFTGLPTLWRFSIPGGDYKYIYRVAKVEETMNILVQGCQRCGGSVYQVEIINILTGLPRLRRP